jgi:hypothetical protein
MYIDGLLAENRGDPPAEWDRRLAESRGTIPVPYDAQPYFPNAPDLPAGGPHLVYLKAWQREVTAVEDPRLVESALGVDTTTRLQTVWQARVLARVGEDVTCATPLADVPGFVEAEPAAAGRLTTGTADVPGDPDPCQVVPGGGYKGLENQLYRVEIHQRGGAGDGQNAATFKWSRDNASVSSRVTDVPVLDRIRVESVGRDSVLRFSDGDWVEITDDWRELNGLPGEMRRILPGGGVDDATRTIRFEQALPAGMFPVDIQGRTLPERNTRVRRWDQNGRVVDAAGNLLVDLTAGDATGTIPVNSGATSILLEHGVVVTFELESESGQFRTGDYWQFAARTSDASVEVLEAAPPRGIHAHYAKLALVTFPATEADCRTLWPPELADGGCACSRCVTPESHASGALTIQAAVEQVKVTGGTVCLGVGTYALREPLRIVDAQSLQIRGQGWGTVIVGSEGSEAVEVASSIGVTLEHLSVMRATPQDDATTMTIRNSAGVQLKDCFVVNLSVGEGRGRAVALAGYLIGCEIDGCTLAAHTGISGGRQEDAYFATAGFRIMDNWLWCTNRGIDLARFGVHVAETRIAGNTIWGCREAGLAVEGGTAPAGACNIRGNFCNVEGTGIAVGVDDARIAENDVRRTGQGAGDGIVLRRGLDPGGLDRCQVLGNRIRGVLGNGIAIRTRLNSGMIKHNIIADVGGGGIVMEGDGAAGHLIVENNQLSNVGQGGNVPGAHPAGMRFVAVRDLAVGSNAIHGVARAAQQAASRAGVSIVAVDYARLSANRLTGVAPAAGFVGEAAAIEVVPPFRSASIESNTLQRRESDEERLASGAWSGLQIRAGSVDGGDGGLRTLGDLAVTVRGERAFVFTATSAYAVAAAAGDVVARGNQVLADATDQAPVLVTSAQACSLSDNRIIARSGRGIPSQLRCARAIATNNDLRGVSDLDVLRLDITGTGDPVVVGNLRTGRILVNGAGLEEPWAALNPLTQ